MADEKLIDIFHTGRRFSYKRDDIIIRAGDIPSGVYYIESGWVKVYTLCKNGEENIIMTLCVGEAFPLAWAVTGILRDIYFVAVDDTETFRISHEQFLDFVKDNAAASYSTLQVLANQSLSLIGELDNLQYRSARERVVYRLLFLAHRFGKRVGTQTIIGSRIPNEYIARSTNMTRETASREMSRLTRKNLILHSKRGFVIPSITKLRDEINDDFDLEGLNSYDIQAIERRNKRFGNAT